MAELAAGTIYKNPDGEEVGVDWVNMLVLHSGDTEGHPFDLQEPQD